MHVPMRIHDRVVTRAGSPGQARRGRARWPGRPRSGSTGGVRVKITAIRLSRLRRPLDPPFLAAWDPVPRRWVGAPLVRVDTDEGLTGYGSGGSWEGLGALA